MGRSLQSGGKQETYASKVLSWQVLLRGLLANSGVEECSHEEIANELSDDIPICKNHVGLGLAEVDEAACPSMQNRFKAGENVNL